MTKVVLFVCFALLEEGLWDVDWQVNGRERDWRMVVGLRALLVAVQMGRGGIRKEQLARCGGSSTESGGRIRVLIPQCQELGEWGLL